MKKNLVILMILSLMLSSCGNQKTSTQTTNVDKAKSTLDSIYKYYSVAENKLLRETYPYNEDHKASYLASAEQAEKKNPYAFLWPFSGSLSAVTALYEAEKSQETINLLRNTVLPGLEMYYDTRRAPDAYASYINTDSLSDRFYDDNIWIGLDFTDLYLLTGQQVYLDKAMLVWKFIQSGTDSLLGGGIYWCEQKKDGKNTCSNAPGSVYALKLFKATSDSSYFHQGKELYEWTKNNLQDPADYLYYDNISMDGKIDKRKFAYNSGQMMQAASLLYNITRDESYLIDARELAKSCYDYFFQDFTTENGETFRLLKKGNVWFTAIMMRGFVELYQQDGNDEYINVFQQNLDYAWTHMRDENGLFGTDWSGNEKDNSKWLLTQFAMAEMYAKLAPFSSKGQL